MGEKECQERGREWPGDSALNVIPGEEEAQDCLPEKITSEKRHLSEGPRGNLVEEHCTVEGRACAKALRWMYAWSC